MAILRFGIASLDELIAASSEHEPAERRGLDVGDSSASICIIGPEGTGKSIFAMHLASRYAADCFDINGGFSPRILYVSTDLKQERAQEIWGKFRLDKPDREIPFRPQEECNHGDPDSVCLHSYAPLGRGGADHYLSAYLLRGEPDSGAAKLTDERKTEVGFVDLASNTTGDDWGFVNRLLAVLPDVSDNHSHGGRATRPHLMVIDAVEGFETFTGERDAFGLEFSRRSRIAQVMRSAGNKCHIVLIVEEAKEGERRAEEFVTDMVVKLRSLRVDRYVRRYVEIEKARSHSHVRGRHPFVIRKGDGSKTGREDNKDDYKVPLVSKDDGPPQAHVQVFPSLQYLSRSFDAGIVPERDKLGFAGFGVKHLDSMLAGNGQPGLPEGEVTALIGEAWTRKTRLGLAFLSQCFASTNSENDGVALYITHRDYDLDRLSEKLAHSLAVHPRNRDQPSRELRERIQKRTICRRMRIHDSPSATLFHIIRRNVEAAQRWMWGLKPSQALPDEGDEHFAQKNSKIRLVIDDLAAFRATYPEIEQDQLFLPYLLFYLERQAITTLIIDSHPGRPATTPSEPFARELRALAKNQIYTWRVPFYGENRIAIAAIPPQSYEQPPLVRELKWTRDEMEIQVDPHFEMYEGLEVGDPKPVPLQVRLYAETPAYAKYIEEENGVFNEVFNPVPRGKHGSDGSVIIGKDTSGYRTLRDLVNLQKDTRLDYTLVLQVDEHWALQSKDSLRSMTPYLNGYSMDENGENDRSVDPFMHFQNTQADDERAKKGKQSPNGTPTTRKKPRRSYFPTDGIWA